MKYILLLTCLLLADYSFAQRNKKVTDIRDLKVLLKPIPIRRAIYHDDIDLQLEKTDYLDGKKDDRLDWRGNEAITKIVNDKIYVRAKELKIYIENETWDLDSMRNVNAKIRYLRQVKENLKTFNDDAYDSKFEPDYYEQMFDNMEGLMLAQKNNTVNEYVEKHAGPGIYVNRDLIDKKSQAYSNIINMMCKKYPAMMLPKILEFPDQSGTCDLMAYLVQNRENDVMSYASSTNPTYRNIVARCNEPKVKAIYEIASNVDSTKRFKALCFLGDLMNNRKSIAEVKKIVNDSVLFFQKLAELRINNEPIYQKQYTEQLGIEAIEYVRIINELHEEKDAVRFKCLESLSKEQLYYIAVLCSDEIYTSSFVKGVFVKLMEKIKPASGDEFLSTINNDKFRTFIRMCANYNTLDNFLATMKTDKQNELMTSFVKGLGRDNKADLEGAVDVADAFGSIKEKELITFLQGKVREEYESNYNSNNIEGLKVYYILFSLFTSKYENEDDSTFNATAQSTLKLNPINKVSFNDLVRNNQIVEHIFFYGDDDGKSSFGSFLGRFNAAEWKRDDSNPNWIKLTAIKSKIPFTIYANRPHDEPKDEEAQIELNNYLIENEITPTIIIHRGHSYHLPHTLKYINENHKIVILGSCGGYHNLSTVLSSSEDAHITSSKQTGTGVINNRIIEKVNDRLYKGNDVDWVTIWDELSNKTFVTQADKELFDDYVPPHKNLGALFIKSYKRLGQANL